VFGCGAGSRKVGCREKWICPRSNQPKSLGLSKNAATARMQSARWQSGVKRDTRQVSKQDVDEQKQELRRLRSVSNVNSARGEKGVDDGGRARRCATEAEKAVAQSRNRYSSRFQMVSPAAPVSFARGRGDARASKGVFQMINLPLF
jgi:hypothetical protein